MKKTFIITGTDTGIGKTVFSASLMLGLEQAGVAPHYWKPIQSGVDEGIDTRTVQKLTKLAATRFLAEKYIFSQSLAPHRAAELDDTQINMNELRGPEYIPPCEGTLMIEGAGGLLVPLTRENLLINLFKTWQCPVILCAKTSLGTINHTLLSLEALWSRQIPVLGIAFIGEDNPDNIRTIAEFSKTKILGRLPIVEKPDAKSLAEAFSSNFEIKDFLKS